MFNRIAIMVLRGCALAATTLGEMIAARAAKVATITAR